MDTEQHSEDLFTDSEVTVTDKDKSLQETTDIVQNTDNGKPLLHYILSIMEVTPIFYHCFAENEDTRAVLVLGEDQETPDLFTEKMPETETFEEPLQLLESIDETPDLLGISDPIETAKTPESIDDEMEDDDQEQNPEEEPAVDEMDIETPDLDLEGDEDVVAESESEDAPVLKSMELQQADFDSGNKKITTVSVKAPHVSKLINLPLGRVKNIMKLDPDVRLMSAESIFVIAKATELFIESLTKECMVHKDPKKKTIQKRDVDQVFASADALMFLEGAMDF